MKTNKQIVAYLLDKIWVEHDISVINEFISEDAELHSPLHTFHGKQSMYGVVEKWFAAFPDLKVTWHDFIGEKDTVVCRFTADGTHLGSFFDTKPSFREVSFSGVMIIRLENGKVVDYWSLVDIHAILSQLEEYATLGEALES